MDRTEAADARERVLSWGRELGLSAVAVAPPEIPARADFFPEWLERGYQASMGYLARSPEQRGDPQAILDGCRAVICACLDYAGAGAAGTGGSAVDPASLDSTLGRISRYAWGDDYHDVLGERLHALADRIRETWPHARTRVSVDTSPVLEKPFAAAAGLGWIGKHTNLIDPRRGSWFFLGEIFTDLPLPPDRPIADHCGSCTRCIEVCPTGAIVEPYVLDAGRCISYWNIEHRGDIDRRFHGGIGNWIFGCDLCQEVCPWNRDPQAAPDPRFAPRPGIIGTGLEAWSLVTLAEFRERFRGSPVKRARFEGFVRNVGIAVQNAAIEKERPMREQDGEVRLYAADWSPECRLARRFLERHKVGYRVIDVEEDASAAEQLQRETGSRIVPALRVGDRWVRVQSRERGFLYREAAEALRIPFDEIPELENRS
jgi:epoxyqueuosine reductase